MDLTIPDHLPVFVKEEILHLISEYQDEMITFKGYSSKRDKILQEYNNLYKNVFTVDNKPSYISFGPMNTETQQKPNLLSSNGSVTNSSISSGINKKILQRMKSTYYMETDSIGNSNKNISRQNTTVSLPLNQSSLLKFGYEPTTPLFPRIPVVKETNKFILPNTSLGAVLSERSEQQGKDLAIITVNSKGKEKAVSWSKLCGKVNKITNELDKLILLLKKKSSNATKNKNGNLNDLSHMSKVLLWYNPDDLIDFVSALFACFNVDLVPVPVNLETYKLSEIEEIIKICDINIVLISNHCHQALENMTDKLEKSNEVFQNFAKVDLSKMAEHHQSNGNKLLRTSPWINLKFIKTSDMGTASKSKKIYQVPGISYIEFTRTPLGILSGVVMRYSTLENQFFSLATILNSRITDSDKKQGFNGVIRPLSNKKHSSEFKSLRVVSTMDPTRSTGLIHGLLFAIYSGNLFIHCSFSNISNKPGDLEKLVGKYRGNVLLIDQLQLKQVVLNYLDNPLGPHSKKHQTSKKIDLSCVKFCLSSCNNIDDETSNMIVKKWLNNLGCMNSSKVYSPMLTLTDFGGIFISLRDELNWTPHSLNDQNTDNSLDEKEDSSNLYADFIVDNDTLFIDKEALKDNEVKIVSIGEGLSYPEKYLKVSSFGYPIPNVTTCIVSPDHKILSPNTVVGEIWITNDLLVNEFYQLPKINDFVFNARLDFSKMNHIVSSSDSSESNALKLLAINQHFQQMKNNTFLRTKLVGFQHNNKIYVLSSIDDVLLQNKLYRLANGKHTSNICNVPREVLTAEEVAESKIPNNLKTFTKDHLVPADLESVSSKNSDKAKHKSQLSAQADGTRILESHYLQHISATLISMSENISEISCFELPSHREEHFLVLLFETPLLKKTTKISTKVDNLLVPLVNNIYKLVWKFHKIQPFLVMAVPEGGLPRRYCSLEIANSFVERQFYNGQLDIKYLKFQMDNLIMDYIPKLLIDEYTKKTSDEGETSLFNSQLSSMRNLALKDSIVDEVTNGGLNAINETDIRLFEQDLKKTLSKKATIDERNGIDMAKKFSNIFEILEYRIKHQPNELAFGDGFVNSNKKSNSNNYHKAVTWKFLSNIIGSYMKKICESKSPLKSGEYVIIMCDNSVEYTAIVLTCMYFGFKIIPMISLSNKNKSVEKACEYLISVVKSFKVKRVFVDYKNHTLLEDTNTLTGKYLKKSKLRLSLCKITLFSKTKIKTSYSLEFFKKRITKTPGYKVFNEVVFLNESDSLWNFTTSFSLDKLFQLCSLYKDSFNLDYSTRNLSVIDHTQHIGFVKSCILGIFLGTSTTLYALSDIKNDCKDFIQDLMHLNLKEVYLNRDLFTFILIKTYDKKIKKVFQNIPHILISYSGRPNHTDLLRLISRYGAEGGCDMKNVNFIFENKFNPFISCRKDEPIVLNLELNSLRNGIVKEVPGKSSNISNNLISVYDIGTMSEGHLKVVNPETLQPTYLTEIGEIVVSSKMNVSDYNCLNLKSNKIFKDHFFNEQFKVDIEGESFIRTGNLGFLKPYLISDNQENIIFNLGSIDSTIEHNGLHFVSDLEKTILETNYNIISKCMCVKVGDYSAALIQMKGLTATSNSAKTSGITAPKMAYNEGNLAPMIATKLLLKHKFVLNMIVFVDYIDTKNRHLTLNKFANNKNNDYIFGIYV